jgi:hypothetical protein
MNWFRRGEGLWTVLEVLRAHIVAGGSWGGGLVVVVVLAVVVRGPYG